MQLFEPHSSHTLVQNYILPTPISLTSSVRSSDSSGSHSAIISITITSSLNTLMVLFQSVHPSLNEMSWLISEFVIFVSPTLTSPLPSTILAASLDSRSQATLPSFVLSSSLNEISFTSPTATLRLYLIIPLPSLKFSHTSINPEPVLPVPRSSWP